MNRTDNSRVTCGLFDWPAADRLDALGNYVFFQEGHAAACAVQLSDKSNRLRSNTSDDLPCLARVSSGLKKKKGSLFANVTRSILDEGSVADSR